MRRYLALAAGVAAAFLAAFLLVEALDVPLLGDPTPWLARAPAVAAGTSVALLVADVLLPVPSSLLMVANGARFGVSLGAALSLAGGLGATLVGFALGRRGGPLLARLVPADERERADRLLARWGALAVALTRPVPIVAETTAVLAGASPMSAARAAAGGVAGTLPIAVFYAATGALAAGSATAAVLASATAFAVAAAAWLAGRRLARAP